MTPNQQPRRPLVGLASIVVGVGFNLPYLQLVTNYDYPEILRRPAAEALDRFAAGGSGLILTWHGFALAALAMAPLAVALGVTPTRIAARPGLAIGAAIFGALAGVMQAVGLWRWVFVVPSLASVHAAPEASAEAMRAAEGAFEILNLYGGVAIGEHLGQLLSAPVMALGTGQGVMLALGRDGEAFSLLTIAGFLGLTVWLIATGLGLMRRS
jgi:hypothetical protein